MIYLYRFCSQNNRYSLCSIIILFLWLNIFGRKLSANSDKMSIKEKK